MRTVLVTLEDVGDSLNPSNLLRLAQYLIPELFNNLQVFLLGLVLLVVLVSLEVPKRKIENMKYLLH